MLPFLLLLALGCSESQTNRRFASGKAGQGHPYGKKILSYFDKATAERIAEIYAPYGAIPKDENFALTTSYHTDAGDLAKELGLAADNRLKPVQVATLVTSTMTTNLKEPITIVIDLPKKPQSFWSMFDSSSHYMVVHTSYDADKGKWTRGVVPAEQTQVKNDQVVVKTTKMGRHEVWQAQQAPSSYPPDWQIPPPDLANPPIAITKASPLVAGTGERVTLTGKYFSRSTVITVAGVAVDDYRFRHANEVSFKLPKLPFGYRRIHAKAGYNAAVYTILNRADKTDRPIISLHPHEVCQGTSYYSAAGLALVGIKACRQQLCVQGNRSGCVASEEFPAIDSSTIDPTKIVKTVTVNGVQGQVKPPKPLPPDCSLKRASQCLTTSRFVPVDRKLMSPHNFRRGVSFPSLGVTGHYPSAARPLAGGSAVFSLSAHNFAPALSSTSGVPYQYWDAYGKRHIISGDSQLKPENIREDLVVYGVKGVAQEGNYKPCSFTGDGNCRARKFDFWAVSKKTLVPENIRSGYRLGRVKGTYPKAGGAGLGDARGNQLTPGRFEDMLTSSKPYTFFDSVGKPHTVRGSANFIPKVIKKDVTIFGVTGQLKQLDTSKIHPATIRAGVKVGKLTGTLRANCRNLGSSPNDTVNDGNKPTQNPWGSEVFRCAQANWQDLTPGGCKRGGKNCIFKDKLTGLVWGGNSGNDKGPQGMAAQYCQGAGRGYKQTGDFGGLSGWRLPTVSEISQAYVHGLAYMLVGHGYFFPRDQKGEVWTSSTTGGAGYVFKTDTGQISAKRTSMQKQVFCVTNDSSRG